MRNPIKNSPVVLLQSSFNNIIEYRKNNAFLKAHKTKSVKLFILFNFLLCIGLLLNSNDATAQNYTYLTEGLENATFPSSSSSTISNVITTTGKWQTRNSTKNNTTFKSGAQSLNAASTSFQLITPRLNSGAGTLTFWAYASSTGRTLVVKSSTTDSANASFSTTELSTSITTTSSWVQYSVNINKTNVKYLQFSISGGSAVLFDDILITAATLIPPTLSSAVSATVDAPFDVTFTDNATWRGAITSITVGGTTLSTSAYSVTTGKITFTPSASTLLQSSGSKSIAIIATGYSNATATQTIGAGAVASVNQSVDPAAPSVNGLTLGTQPVVIVRDQYNNLVSGASVTASVNSGQAGAWTLGGTTTVSSNSSGVVTFTNLTAGTTDGSAYSNALITFTSNSITYTPAFGFEIPTAPVLLPSPPELTAAGSATVDAPFDITFTDDGFWKDAISSITINGTLLTAGYSVSNDKITFTPSASFPANLLQTSGSKSIVIYADGYSEATVIQTIGAGAVTQMVITTQPTAPLSNGGTLAAQPVVALRDQYGNTTTSTLSITAASSGGSWNLGGTASKNAVSGIATFTGLTAGTTGLTLLSGATITFSATGLSNVVSSPSFTIPAYSSAATDYFRSKGNGNGTGTWSSIGLWESSPDNLTWYNATAAPSSSAVSTIIQSGDIVTISGTLSIPSITINSGGELSLASGLSAGAITFGSKTVTVNGKLTCLSTTTVLSGATTTNLFFGAGSTFTLNANGGCVPAANWNSSSTLYIGGANWTSATTLNGVSGAAAATSNLIGQPATSFGNITLDFPALTVNNIKILTGFRNNSSLTINGNFTLLRTNSNTVQVFTSSGATGLTCQSLNVNCGNWLFNNSSYTVTVNSNFRMVDSLSATSGYNVAALSFGTTASNNLIVKGNFTQSIGSINSGAATQIIQFNGSSTQTAAFTTLTGAGLGMTINNGSSVVLNTALTLPGILTLTSGRLDIGSNILTLNNTSAVAGSFSNSNMIVADGGGEVRHTTTATGSFTFPIGDNSITAEYSPITVNVTSASGFSTAYIGVSVIDSKHLNNYSSTDYLTRYWNVKQSGITGCVVTITSSFINTSSDVAGTLGSIKAAQLNGTFNQSTNPWVKFGTALSGTPMTITGATLTNNVTSVFTGITGTDLSVTVSGGGTVCQNTPVTLTANTVGGDGTFTFSWDNGLGSSSTASPSTVTAGGPTTYTVTVKDANGITATNNDVVTITAQPSATIAYSSTIGCTTSGTEIVTLTGTTGGAYSSTSDLSINSSTGAIDIDASTQGNYTVTYTVAASGGCSSFNTTASVAIKLVNWLGGSSNDWNDGSNWSCNAVPGSTNDVLIQLGVSFDPVISSGTMEVKNLTIGATGNLTMSGGTLAVYGDWSNSGSFIPGEATVDFSASGSQNITTSSSGDNFYNLTLSGSGTKSLVSSAIKIKPSGTVTIGSGVVLDMNSKDFTLQSASGSSFADNTARIATLPDGASNIVNASKFHAERYIPAKRALRFLSSPVSGAKVSDWANNMFITGAGNTNFPDNIILSSTTPTVTVYKENLNALSKNKFTNIASVNTALEVGKGYRAFIRGGRDIDTNPAIVPTPTATTLSVTGSPNMGSITVNLQYTDFAAQVDAEEGWNLVGNPYPSQIDWENISVAGLSNVPNSFSIFDPESGASGAYYTYAGGVGTGGRANPSIIPSSQSFFVKLISPGAGSITFNESDKVGSAHTGNFRAAAIDLSNLLRVKLSDSLNKDEAIIQFKDGAVTEFDNGLDALKFSNTALNISSLTPNAMNLAINRTPLADSITIPLAVSSSTKGKFKISFAQFESFTSNTQLYLKDNYLNQSIAIDNNTTYEFDITSDVNSSGNNRFEIAKRTSAVTGINNLFNNNHVALMKVYPNPVSGSSIIVDLYNMKEPFNISVTDVTGKELFTKTMASYSLNSNFASLTLDEFQTLGTGVYIIKCLYDSNILTSKVLVTK